MADKLNRSQNDTSSSVKSAVLGSMKFIEELGSDDNA